MKHRTSTQWLDYRRTNDREVCDTWAVGHLMARFNIHAVARHYTQISGALDTLEAIYEESCRNPMALEWMLKFHPSLENAA